MSARKPKGAPTSLNLWCLKQHFNGAAEAPSAVDATEAPHLRRCLRAGLCTVDRARGLLILTDAGAAAIATVRQ